MKTLPGASWDEPALAPQDVSLNLPRAMRDLAALATLPSIWVDSDVRHSIQNLADVLRSALRSFTVCVRIELPDASQFDAMASEGLLTRNDCCHEAVELLNAVDSGSVEPVEIPRFNGSGPLTALPQPIFFAGRQIGYIIACYRQGLLPSPTDRLLLHVAASQVMLLLQRHKDQEERSARRVAEDRLRQTEYHYRQLVQSLPAAVYTCDSQGRITLYNHAAVTLWGREPEIGKDMWCGSWKIFKPDGTPLPLEECPMALALREGRSVRGEEIIVERPDGTRSFVLPHPDPIRDESGAIIGSVNMLVVVDDLKSVEQALRSSEFRLQSLLNLMPAAVYACDAEGRITFYNRRAAELWGREPALHDDHQKFCAACKCFFNGALLAPQNTPMAIAVREGKSFRNLEPEFERPDGVRVPVLVNVDPILDADGKPAGAINVFQDVTALKHAEADLRRKNNQLAAFLDTAVLGLHRVGPDGIILWANAAEMDMLGYTPEEYIGHHITEFHADRPVIDDILKVLACGEKLNDREARLRCKDGSIKHVLIDSSVLWEDGKFIHTQCFTRDVTDRKRGEETAARLAAIVEHSDDAIFSCDLSGNIKSWNRGAERLYGYTAAEAVGQYISVLLPETRQGEEADILKLIRQGQAVENYETLRRRKDGSLFHVSLTISPVKDQQGNVVGISKVARDITDKVRARDKLEQAVAERTASLKEAIAQMEEFSYSVSHDLRAPVRAMQGYANALTELYGGGLDARARDYLDRIARGSSRMDRLIQDVLTYSRVAKDNLSLQPVSLPKLLEDIILHYPEFRTPHAEILIRGPLLDVQAHEPSLMRVISNLLSNAVKFVAPGTTPKVQVWTELRENGVRLWFEDNGIGIRPEHQGRLFGMFERIHNTSQYSGSGIGLAIVRKTVEKMGGKVGVQSDGITGASFWIELHPLQTNGPSTTINPPG